MLLSILTAIITIAPWVIAVVYAYIIAKDIVKGWKLKLETEHKKALIDDDFLVAQEKTVDFLSLLIQTLEATHEGNQRIYIELAGLIDELLKQHEERTRESRARNKRKERQLSKQNGTTLSVLTDEQQDELMEEVMDVIEKRYGTNPEMPAVKLNDAPTPTISE